MLIVESWLQLQASGFVDLDSSNLDLTSSTSTNTISPTNMSPESWSWRVEHLMVIRMLNYCKDFVSYVTIDAKRLEVTWRSYHIN